ncbi:hypothetical protein, partial [Acinetobacter sp. P1(2025)]|uniref:hypothetical protein n=1 Tax=Acinetobacter sp. P1(2025) TaxID=3446120 RepID=UPI003F532B5D
YFGEGSIIGSIVNTMKDTVGGIFGENSLLGNIGNAKTASSVEDLVVDDTHINLDALLPATETVGVALATEMPVAVNSTPELLMAMNDQQYHVA